MTEPRERLAAAHELLVGQVAKLTTSAEWRAMLEAARHFHAYSPRNVLLLLAQGAQGRVAGYRAWQRIPAQDDNPCQVARGAKGHMVLAPLHRVVRDTDEHTGEERMQRWLRGFKVVHVFDETQLVAPPAIPEVRPQVLRGVAPTKLTEGLAAFVRAQGFRLVERDLHPAFGQTDFAAREVATHTGLAAAARTKTLAHEAAHIVLHDPQQETARLSRERREVEAESVAYLVAAEAQLDTSAYSFPYIARWAHGDLGLVRDTAERAIAAARTLTTALEVHLVPELGITPAAEPAAVIPMYRGPVSVPGPDVSPELLDSLERDTASAFQWLASNHTAWGATSDELQAVLGILDLDAPNQVPRPVAVVELGSYLTATCTSSAAGKTTSTANSARSTAERAQQHLDNQRANPDAAEAPNGDRVS